MWRILLLLSCLGILACGSDAEQVSDSDASAAEKTGMEKRQIYQVTIDNLRLRRTPDLSGIVLRKLDLGTKVEYLNEKTNFKTPIEMSGETVAEPWFRVRVSEGDTGWVYGACIKFLTEISIDTTVKESEEETEVAYLEKTVERIQPPKLDGEALRTFDQQLQNISSPRPHNIGIALRRFKQFANQYSKAPATVDAAFVKMWRFLDQQLAFINRKQSFAAYRSFETELRRYGRANMSLNEQTQAWAANGLRFGFQEGKLFLKEDADFWVRETYRYVSDAMRSYLDQYQREERTGWLQDGQLQPSVAELAEWMRYWEEFLLNHPYAALRGEAKEHLGQAQRFLLEGTAQTPAFDNSGKLRPAFKKVYELLLKKSSEAGAQQSLRQYLQALAENDFQDNRSLQRRRRAIYEAKTPRG